MVSIFKTNIQADNQAKAILQVLQNTFPNSRINFDLDDCDKILRIEASVIYSVCIISAMDKLGFKCVELEDKVCLKKGKTNSNGTDGESD